MGANSTSRCSPVKHQGSVGAGVHRDEWPGSCRHGQTRPGNPRFGVQLYAGFTTEFGRESSVITVTDPRNLVASTSRNREQRYLRRHGIRRFHEHEGRLRYIRLWLFMAVCYSIKLLVHGWFCQNTIMAGKVSSSWGY